MRILKCAVLTAALLLFVFGMEVSVSLTFAQTASDVSTVSGSGAPVMGSASAASFGQTPTTQSNLTAQTGWPNPVDDQQRNLFFLADVLEYQPSGRESQFRWDIEGWYGGDFNRLWYKTEGRSSDRRTDYNLDFQLLYGRFVWRYYDFQIGGRVETATFRGRNVTRGHTVIGLEGLVPYNYEFESALFLSQNGDVSGRLTLTKDLLLTQRLILQPRLETNVAIQKVEKFGVGRGMNDVEFGLRLRYEIRREIAPYMGVSFERNVGGTAGLVRREGGDPSRIGFVVGARLWW